jgi:hypothetical protein
VAVEMPRLSALLMTTTYGHGEMVIMANWVVEVLMVARLVFLLQMNKCKGGTMLVIGTAMQSMMFWGVTPCNMLKAHHPLGRTSSFHLQGWKVSQERGRMLSSLLARQSLNSSDENLRTKLIWLHFSLQIPMKIESLAGLGVIKVECGSQFSVALTRSGSVYTW